ncbi:hypothetical protein QWY93_18335 [Echinicola jeungdonensis]|uniref:hypothetical protein n=1 Tax=Echinicola jeungdonensis TaxID=709343 RepID=UPI0025B2B220|nr:hypothetical protein [Echinicola jeungdonensis]MDN3671263.1 hypothetical protein [Echinicola jeungdonensis]
MKAMVLHKIVNLSDQSHPLELRDIPKPVPKADEVLIRVNVCGVCHTEWMKLKEGLHHQIACGFGASSSRIC